MIMQGFIDRFEGELAVIETSKDMIWIDRKELPEQAGEGDLVIKQAGGWVVDKQASTARKKQIEKLAEELWEDKDS